MGQPALPFSTGAWHWPYGRDLPTSGGWSCKACGHWEIDEQLIGYRFPEGHAMPWALQQPMALVVGEYNAA
jgi:hypothetical protein